MASDSKLDSLVRNVHTIRLAANCTSMHLWQSVAAEWVPQAVLKCV